MQAVKKCPSLPSHKGKEHKIAKTPVLIKVTKIVHAIIRVIIFRLLYGNFEFRIRTVYRTKNIKTLWKNRKKNYIQRSKNKMKRCRKKTLQQIITLTFFFKMRRQTTKSIKNFFRSCIAKGREVRI